MFTGLLEELVEQLKRLPGIGSKSAQRLAMFLLNQDKEKSLELAEAIRVTVENIGNCSQCNMLTESDPCIFCSNTARNQHQLCIVENSQDVYLIENTGEYHGRYFVLGGLLSPLDGKGPNEIKFPMLKQFVNNNEVDEIIIAINPSAEGETTMNYIASQLGELVDTITRLSTGLPFGSDIEYTSAVTLKNALKRRYSISD